MRIQRRGWLVGSPLHPLRRRVRYSCASAFRMTMLVRIPPPTPAKPEHNPITAPAMLRNPWAVGCVRSAGESGRRVPALIAVFELRAAPVLTESSKVKGDGSKNPWSPPVDGMLQRGYAISTVKSPREQGD